MYTRIMLFVFIIVGCMDSFQIEKSTSELESTVDSANPNDQEIDNDNDGVSTNQGDCDDNDPNISPLLMETPYDGIDNDCNPSTLDDDLDQDGYSFSEDCDDLDSNIYIDCPIDQDLDGVTIEDGDCNDNDPNIYPGHPDDNCDNLDNNCNREIDEDWNGDQLENGEALHVKDDDDIYLVGYTFPDEDLDQFILETTIPRTIDIEPGHDIDIHIAARVNESWVEILQASTDELFSFELYPDEIEASLFKIELYSSTGDCSHPYELQIGYP